MGTRNRNTPEASDLCSCGHPREAHEHYRKGTECSICDVRQCSAFSLATTPVYSKTS